MMGDEHLTCVHVVLHLLVIELLRSRSCVEIEDAVIVGGMSGLEDRDLLNLRMLPQGLGEARPERWQRTFFRQGQKHLASQGLHVALGLRGGRLQGLLQIFTKRCFGAGLKVTQKRKMKDS